MALKDAKAGSLLSARDLRRLGRAADMARPVQSFGAGASTQQTAGGFGSTDPGDDWFPVEIVSVIDADAGQYTFKEIWLDGDGDYVDKPSGRVNDDDTPAVLLDGATTPTELAEGDYAVARRARGAGGMKWELLPIVKRDPVAWTCGGGAYTWVVLITEGGASSWDQTVCLGKFTLPAAGPYLFFWNVQGSASTLGPGYVSLSARAVAGATVVGGGTVTLHAFSETPSADTLNTTGGTAGGVAAVNVSGPDLDVYLYARLFSTSHGGGGVSGSIGYIPLSSATVEVCTECASESGSGGGGGTDEFYCFDMGDTVTVYITNKTGTCTDLPDEVTLTRYGASVYDYEWRGDFTYGGETRTARLCCPCSINPWSGYLNIDGETITPVSQDEGTLTWITDITTTVGISACDGSYRLTFVGSG